VSAQATAADVLSGAARWACTLGDVRESLRTLPDESVQCVVTSPPYYGLRDYGTASWKGGDPACDHVIDADALHTSFAAASTIAGTTTRQKDAAVARLSRNGCPRCGARRVDAQIGMEPTPAAYVETMRALFAEIRRVLRADGTAWLNLGDSYAAQGGAHGGRSDNQRGVGAKRVHMDGAGDKSARHAPSGLKPKDLVGIPWRVAFALQDDGWWLRSDIVWAKPNPMPESITDRPTRAHEYVFLLTKSARYFYDADAVREPVADSTMRDARIGTERVRDYDAARDFGAGTGASRRNATNAVGLRDGRNARSVWAITPEPYAGAHFATMPPELARRCILAGSRKGDVVLDPFGGSGTTALVAVGHGRRAILCELNEEYAALQRERLAEVDADFSVPVRVAPKAAPVAADPHQLSLLGGAR
jgi:DNA modification methylase